LALHAVRRLLGSAAYRRAISRALKRRRRRSQMISAIHHPTPRADGIPNGLDKAPASCITRSTPRQVFNQRQFLCEQHVRQVEMHHAHNSACILDSKYDFELHAKI
jgi:hypothetical protein